MKRLSTLLMLTTCLALNGCGLLGDSPEAPEYKPSPVENFMANAVPGDITTLSDPAFGTDVRVSMEDSFFSAAGEECKRATVRNNFNEAEIIVACRNGARACVPLSCRLPRRKRPRTKPGAVP